jgi:YVTN family beta-propeller protein
MNLKNQIMPWLVRLGAFALALHPIARGADEGSESNAAYQPSGMGYPYGVLSPELVREVLRADAGDPPSRFGKLTSKQWTYGATWTRENLRPVPNPHPAPEPQPRRDHPFDVAVCGDGTKAYISLLGSELRPGSEIAVYDVASGKMAKRIPLKLAGEPGPAGSAPMRLHLHPNGRHLFVGDRFSNFISVIDTKRDEVVFEIPLDFYAQGMTFSPDGKTAWVANRYLDEVFVIDINADGDKFDAKMRVIGGLDDQAYFAPNGVGKIMQQSCGTMGCHDVKRGGFVAGADLRESFISALDHVVPGRSAESRLLRAVTRSRDGGYADAMPLFSSHANQTVVFGDPAHDADYQAVAKWIDSTQIGPGIAVGNPRSKPRVLALSSDGRHLYVGNSGTSDISIIDTRLNQEVGAIYIQNCTNDLKILRSATTGDDWLIVATMGVGFGTAKERDPWGGETWDRTNGASQYTVWRDPNTAAVYPKEQQEILGPFEATDGTANVKFRDIQNDIVVINLSKLSIPEQPPKSGLTYLLKANRYEAHRNWVRYTSDTAESMYGDIKGDIPPDLMRIVGALPEKLAVVGDRVFVSMQGSGEVQELQFNPEAPEPSDILTPVRNYEAGVQSFGLAAGVAGTLSDGKMFVANFFSNTLSVIDRATGKSHEVVVDPSILRLPVPATSAERGEFLVHTSHFSSDHDQSCVSCHHDELSDGRPWGVSQIMGQEYLSGQDKIGQLVEGTTMLAPQQKSLWGIQPFFMEGSLSVYDPRSMLMEHCPADDFKAEVGTGDYRWLEAHRPVLAVADIQSKTTSTLDNDSSLEERRAEFFRRTSLKYFGKAFVLRDFQRFVGEWQAHEPRLMPNPFDQNSASVNRGKALFNHPQLGCASCHPAPNFAKKDFPNNPRQVVPPQVPLSMRDAGFTLISMHRLDYLAGIRRDLEPWDIGRVETPEQNQHITPLQLRGAWDRPPVFLHNGMARSLREVVAAPGVPGLGWFKYEPLFGGSPERPGRREIGFNETYMIPKGTPAAKVHLMTGGRIASDAHGGTSQLTPQQIDDLVNYLETIE